MKVGLVITLLSFILLISSAIGLLTRFSRSNMRVKEVTRNETLRNDILNGSIFVAPAPITNKTCSEDFKINQDGNCVKIIVNDSDSYLRFIIDRISHLGGDDVSRND